MSYRDEVMALYSSSREALDMRHFAAHIAARADAEITQLRADAERYRWLRDPNRGMHGLREVISDDYHPPYFELKCGESLDKAIDAARGGE